MSGSTDAIRRFGGSAGVAGREPVFPFPLVGDSRRVTFSSQGFGHRGGLRT